MSDILINNKFIEIEVLGLGRKRWRKDTCYLILADKTKNNLRMNVVIGRCDAQNIAIELEGLKPQLPLSHDLMKNIVEQLNAKLECVKIDKVIEGVFYAIISIKNQNGELLELESRLVDAIALAIRCKSRILLREEILKEYSVVMQ